MPPETPIVICPHCGAPNHPDQVPHGCVNCGKPI